MLIIILEFLFKTGVVAVFFYQNKINAINREQFKTLTEVLSKTKLS